MAKGRYGPSPSISGVRYSATIHSIGREKMPNLIRHLEPALNLRAQATRRRISEALVPPNPNEFDNTVLISRCFGVSGTKSIAV